MSFFKGLFSSFFSSKTPDIELKTYLEFSHHFGIDDKVFKFLNFSRYTEYEEGFSRIMEFLKMGAREQAFSPFFLIEDSNPLLYEKCHLYSFLKNMKRPDKAVFNYYLVLDHDDEICGFFKTQLLYDNFCPFEISFMNKNGSNSLFDIDFVFIVEKYRGISIFKEIYDFCLEKKNEGSVFSASIQANNPYFDRLNFFFLKRGFNSDFNPSYVKDNPLAVVHYCLPPK